jgi:hypothetical protein
MKSSLACVHLAPTQGASNLAEFNEKAVIGIQSAAGYAEGRPLLYILEELIHLLFFNLISR